MRLTMDTPANCKSILSKFFRNIAFILRLTAMKMQLNKHSKNSHTSFVMQWQQTRPQMHSIFYGNLCV